jgi:predicted dinucleotide-binding enzyme
MGKDISMNIAILGTGVVGQTIGGKLVELGHKVKMGSRTADNPKAAEWVKKCGSGASQGTFADAAAFGELLFNCTTGAGSLPALESAGAANLKGKVLVDVSNPLDFSKGMPPTLSVCNDDSLGERIQKAFPDLQVVKSLNTLTAALMVNPGLLAGGDHTVFLCGNDAGAKEKVSALLKSFGWRHILDLGDITTARGTEMALPLWLRLWGALQTPMFNYKIVR